jgi:hypothetical protein
MHRQALLLRFEPLLLVILEQFTQVRPTIVLVLHRQLSEVKSHVKVGEQIQLFPNVVPVV